MSRIGNKPVPIPKGVDVTVSGRTVTVKGPRGTLTRTVHPDMQVTVADGRVAVARPSDERLHRALHGLTRALLANMVEGVTKGYRKQLELHGVGYKAEAHAKGVRLVVGLSHPVEFPAPAGIKILVDNATQLKIEGIDKELVGQVAAEIREVRPPEPYKGKGIRYVGEHVRRKAGKTGAKTG
jgi:large subunit ribosomal protein L6